MILATIGLLALALLLALLPLKNWLAARRRLRDAVNRRLYE